MIEEKEQYTFEELCEGLEISMSKFAKLADVDEGTIARIRKGHFVRIGTINRLLRTFSEVYGRRFTSENVTGLKKVGKPIDEKAEKPSIPSPVVQSKPVAEKAPTRIYSRKQDTSLPEGCISATEFGLAHSVKRETFKDHMLIGLGPPGTLIHGPDVPEDGSVQIKDWVRYEERNKRVRKDGTIEKERYLTADQQKAALEFWQRHNVNFTQCESTPCWCHTFLEETE